jgi:hypothetical protein
MTRFRTLGEPIRGLDRAALHTTAGTHFTLSIETGIATSFR